MHKAIFLLSVLLLAGGCHGYRDLKDSLVTPLGSVQRNDCDIRIEGLRFEAGDIAVKYLDEVTSTINRASIDTAPRLSHTSIYDADTDTWAIETATDDCDAPSQIVLWCENCNVDGRPVADIALAATGEQNYTSAVVIVFRDASLQLDTDMAVQSGNSRRSLLQANNNCPAVNINGKNYQFDVCVDFAAALKLSVPFTLQYTLSQSSNGRTIIKGAITAKTTGWASVGFPSGGKSGMIGANTIYVAPSASGANVYGILMKTYNAGGINAAKGTFPLTETAGVKNADGSYAGVFTGELPDDTFNSMTTTPRRVIYGIGRMDGSNLGTHITSTRGTYPWGKATLQFKASSTATEPAATPTTPAKKTEPTAPPATTVAPPQKPSRKQKDSEDDDDDDNVTAPTIGTNAAAINGGFVTVSGGGGGGSVNESLLTAHIWLMTIGWGVLIPLGVVIAHAFKEHNPLWFQVHRICQTVGLAAGIAGLIVIGIYCDQKYGTVWDPSEEYEDHRNIGVAAIAVGLVMALSLVWRPAKDSSLRLPWYIAHVLMGLGATGLAIYNIYDGFNLEGSPTWAVVAFSVVLGLILTVGLGKDVYDIATGRRGWNMVRKPAPRAGTSIIGDVQPVKGAISSSSGAYGIKPSSSSVISIPAATPPFYDVQLR